MPSAFHCGNIVTKPSFSDSLPAGVVRHAVARTEDVGAKLRRQETSGCRCYKTFFFVGKFIFFGLAQYLGEDKDLSSALLA